MSLLRGLLVGRANIDRGTTAKADAREGSPATASTAFLDEQGRAIGDAMALGTAARRGDALALVASALARAPEDPELLFARAKILFDWGRYREALDGYLQAEASGKRGSMLQLQLGWSYLRTGQVDRAEARMRQAIAADPELSSAHYGLALALRVRQQHDAATVSLERSVELDPNDFDSLVELGNRRVECNDAIAGEALFRRAIALHGDRPIAWQNLGVALVRQRRFEDARQALEHAEELEAQNGGDLDSFANLAIELGDQGETCEALALYERMLPQRPGVRAHHAYAQLLLAAGRFLEGWHHFEFRWLNEPLLSARFRSRRPAWAGQSLEGKAIRLRLEQGLGDVIQFVRYAPLLKRLGAEVQLPKFDDLASGFSGIDGVVPLDAPSPEFDYHVNLLSLPGIFGTELTSIPVNIPYLSVQPEKVAQWRARVTADDTLRVGLVWAGNPAHPRDRERSMALDVLAPLSAVAGVRWYSLQKGGCEPDAASAPRGFDWVDLGAELNDFGDTAAVISELDLTLCVDTAVAHLAGALGMPVWVLLAEPSDWRWLQGREDSPWYPTMRLFRQKRRGDWEDVVARVKQALEDLVQASATQVASTSKKRSPTSTPNVSAQPIASIGDALRGHRPGFSAVAETRWGILQYLPDEPDLGASLAWYGEWLQSELDMLAPLFKQGATVLEMAAGVGAHALWLANAIGPTGHLILHETRSLQRRILRQNLMANRIGNATLLDPATDVHDAPPPTETVDELCLEKLDWLKLNDDTAASTVLDGASETLWRLRPFWLSATTTEQTGRTLADRASSYGYRCWLMETALFNQANFNHRTTNIFVGRKALAVLAIPEETDVDLALVGGVELS